MDSCLQVSVSCTPISNHVSTGQVCSAVCGVFAPLIILDGVVYVEFNGMHSKVFLKKEYGTQ